MVADSSFRATRFSGRLLPVRFLLEPPIPVENPDSRAPPARRPRYDPSRGQSRVRLRPLDRAEVSLEEELEGAKKTVPVHTIVMVQLQARSTPHLSGLFNLLLSYSLLWRMARTLDEPQSTLGDWGALSARLAALR